MSLGFIVGDTVNIDRGGTIIQGEVIRIEENEASEPILVEIRRSGGSCHEFGPDESSTFDFITKEV